MWRCLLLAVSGQEPHFEAPALLLLLREAPLMLFTMRIWSSPWCLKMLPCSERTTRYQGTAAACQSSGGLRPAAGQRPGPLAISQPQEVSSAHPLGRLVVGPPVVEPLGEKQTPAATPLEPQRSQLAGPRLLTRGGRITTVFKAWPRLSVYP